MSESGLGFLYFNSIEATCKSSLESRLHTLSSKLTDVHSGNALTDFFFRDVGITQNQFNIGQQLLSLGIVLLEIPSNIILYRVGPSLWIGTQIIAWCVLHLKSQPSQSY